MSIKRKVEAATRARQETRTFNHQCALALAAYGYPVARIAETIGTSPRSVQRYLAGPCAEYMADREAHTSRLSRMDKSRAAMAVKPFCHPDDRLTDQEIKSRNLRHQIAALLADGVRKAEIARRLSMSRRMVSYHSDKLPPIDVRNDGDNTWGVERPFPNDMPLLNNDKYGNCVRYTSL
ncbi:helix-turn-helix transcriptional regulator [Rhizobium sp. Rhizsp82]|uniref:helix-turn-helix transcriptional regulator n=1 Tax=Rhizobium sp. Rhizsp82 TaxID=3243057 RepID=UPI0039B65D99